MHQCIALLLTWGTVDVFFVKAGDAGLGVLALIGLLSQQQHLCLLTRVLWVRPQLALAPLSSDCCGGLVVFFGT